MHPAAGQLPPFSGKAHSPGGHPPGGGPGPVFPQLEKHPARALRRRGRSRAEGAHRRECIPGQGFNTKTINRAAALAVVTYIPGLSGQGDAPLTEVQAAGWEMFDAGIAAQTFCLAARELDIGTCILGIFDADAAGRLLELEGQRAACLIAMGYPEQWKNGPGRKETESCCRFR